MPRVETFTCTVTVPDDYELAPGPQPRVPDAADRANGYGLLTAKGTVVCIGTSEKYYFILRKAPIGIKLVFVDVRPFKDVPTNGTYTCNENGRIGTYTIKKRFENTSYTKANLDVLVAYYIEEPLYTP